MLKRIFDRILEKIVKGRRSYGLQGLDLKLKPYLSEIKNGFFVEAGANDGIAQSNTFYFEKNYGWRGILIEAIPDLAKRAKKNRPKAIIEQVALVGDTYKEKHITMRYGGLMSLVRGGMKTKAEEDQHIANAKNYKNIETYAIEVPVSTLTNIMYKNNVSHIDFLSLDVEGYEQEVLTGLDTAKYRPTFILVEARYKNDIDCFMKENHYAEIAQLSHHDYLYKDNK